MPFHKPLVQEFQRAEEAELARQRESDAADDEWVRNMEARAAVRARLSSSAFPTEQPASPTLAADELQSSAVPSMPAPPTEQPAGYVSPDLAPPPPAGTKRKVLFSPVVECVTRLVNWQPADSTTRPIATPARRPEGSPLQCGLAVPRCETEVQDQIVSNSLSVPMAETSAGQGQDQIVANPPAVPMAASQSALVAFQPEAAGSSGAGQLLAEYYSMLVSCTTQVACAY